MKIIISHDIDHWNWTDHIFKDLYIPKYIIKNLYYGLSRKIPFGIMINRLTAVFHNQMSRVDELITFDKVHGVDATYFIGMSNGLSLSYSKRVAKKIIQKIKKAGFEIGVHGIAWDNFLLMKKEYEMFKELSGTTHFGIRNHYLRISRKSLDWMNEIGYSYDTSTSSLDDPYFIGEMVEFPVCLMDVHVLSMSSNDLAAAKAKTIELISIAEDKNLSFFTIIFHDNYFAKHYPSHMKWYQWFIPWITAQGHEFISFKSAIRQIKENELMGN